MRSALRDPSIGSLISRSSAEAESEDEDEEDEDLLRRTGNFIGSSDSLPKGTIKIKKCVDANSESPADAKLTSVQFHPSAQILMTSSLDHSISLFQVDGKTNAKIQTIHLEKFPVNKASFSADGEQIVATGWKNKLFYIYDMMEGRIIPVTNVRGLNEQKVSDFQVSPDGKYLLLFGSSGFLHLMSSKTREVVRSMKLNGKVCAAAFTADGSKIFANSEEGEVFIWDVQSSKCVKRFEDDGCVRGTSLALSRDGSYLACGSQAGVVNIYSQRDCLLDAEPKPQKAVLNLLTAVTSLSFNSSAEILAIGSRHADEANRLHRSQSAMVSFTPAPTRHHEAWVVPQRKTRVRFRPRLSPTLPVFELSTQNRFSPLRETTRCCDHRRFHRSARTRYVR
ncbi:hypothetical protein PO909_005090 [Leuciscus waleckii]